MFLKIKKNNQGTALILTILITGVLFALSSFLISQVLINTKIVEKATSDEENYNLAKLGILYAIERLNNRLEEVPDYDSIDWPTDTNWIELDLDNKDGDSDATTGDKECRVRVDKDDLPRDAFSLSSDDSDTSYLTIESQDIKKKVTLQAVAEYKSPLTEYVRLIGSDTTFGNNTFGSSGMIQGNAPFCVLGDLKWENGSTNNLNLSPDSKAVVYGKVTSFDETSTILNINGSPPDAGHYYTDSSNPKLFNTADGQYFDRAHLPSCFDYSDGDPAGFYCGNLEYRNPESTFWPKIINEGKGETIINNRYQRLAQANGIYIGGSPTPESNNWYPSFPPSSGTGWSKDSSITSSYTYTGAGTLIILDGNGQTSGTAGQVGIDDGKGGETANDGLITGNEWRAYPSNGVIYSPGNLRVCGVIGDDNGTPSDPSDDLSPLTIVSGGTIYIESNIFKGTGNSSLALLAKDYVTLNTTHRFMRGVDPYGWSLLFGWIWGYHWSPSPYKNILGERDGNQLSFTSFVIARGIAIMDLGQQVSATEIDLNNVDFDSVVNLVHFNVMEVYGSNNDSTDISSDTLFGVFLGINFLSLVESRHYEKIRCYQDADAPSVVNPTGFRYIKIRLLDFGALASQVSFDSVEVPLTNIENTLFFAQGGDKSWAVIPGNVDGYDFTVDGSIAEGNFDKNKEQSFRWPNISYTFNSDIANNPPPYLPSSVNLISSRRE